MVWMIPDHVGLHVFGLSQDAGSQPLSCLAFWHVDEEESWCLSCAAWHVAVLAE